MFMKGNVVAVNVSPQWPAGLIVSAAQPAYTLSADMGADLCATSLLLAWALATNAHDPLADRRQDTLPDWVVQLSRVKSHLKENFERIPNYVCQESVERFERRPGQAQAKRVDSLHFEVARVQDKELLAMPGAAGFEDRSLSAYMSSGVLGTGMFSTLPLSLFVANVARITLHQAGSGRHTRAGYDYEIPGFLGGLEIAAGQAKATVGVAGTFWVDAESMDLIRVEEHAVEVPPKVGMKKIDWTVDYARMRIGDSSVLLPQSADLVVTQLDGWERRNKIGFSGCREYTSESTVRFGDATELPPVEKNAPASQEGSASTTAIPGWKLSGTHPDSYRIFVDRAERREGRSSGTIVCTTAGCGDPGTLMQSFRADEYRGRRVRLSAWVKTKNAGRANLWMRVDGVDSKVLAFDNMSNRSKSGTLDWHRQEIVLAVPQRAVLIAFGLTLEERGQAWLDDVSLETADKKGHSTGQPVAGSPSGAQNTEARKQIAAKPLHPVNLNFEQ
jgi:hypothetical protein